MNFVEGVNRGFLGSRLEWLPTTCTRRTLGRKDKPIFWLGINDLLLCPRKKKVSKKGRTPTEVNRRINGKQIRKEEWTALLAAGTVKNRAALARHLGLSRAYVTQVLGPVLHAVHAVGEDEPHGGDWDVAWGGS